MGTASPAGERASRPACSRRCAAATKLARVPRPLAPTAAAGCLAALRRTVAEHADAWVDASLRAKGWAAVSHARAEEWASGPLPVARWLAQLALAPPRAAAPGAVLRARSLSRTDAVLLAGHRAAIHVDAPAAHEAPVDPAPRGGTCLVLGAGNVTATPLLDALEQVFVHGRAVVLKPSPLHAPLQPVFESVLAPLLAADALEIAAGDAAAGRALAQRADVTAIHLTGSAATWSALRADASLRGKHLTAEVGCSTPALVLPGPWSRGELAAAAGQLAAHVATNGGATCAAPRVLLTAAGWPQRAELVAALERAFAALPARAPFHPSAREHWQVAAGEPAPAGALPPRFVAGQRGEHALALCGEEWFAPVLREFALPVDELAAFAHEALAFVAAHCFGRLSAYVFAPRAVLRERAPAVDALVAALPHGTIAINTWTGLAYGLGTTPWGVPAASPAACGSGFARNLTGAAVRRVVVRAPLQPIVPPPWLPQHRRAVAALRCLTLHTLRPSLWRFLHTALHALRP